MTDPEPRTPTPACHPVVMPVARTLFDLSMCRGGDRSQRFLDRLWDSILADGDVPWAVDASRALSAGLRAVVEYYGGADDTGPTLKDLRRLADDIDLMAHRSTIGHLS